MNWRLRQRGETVWFDPELAADYRPRETLGALARQYFRYGWWKRVMLRRHPASLRWRQTAAPLLMLALGLSALLAVAGGALTPMGADATASMLLRTAAAAPLSYLLLILGGAAVVGMRRRARPGRAPATGARYHARLLGRRLPGGHRATATAIRRPRRRSRGLGPAERVPDQCPQVNEVAAPRQP